MSTPTLVTCPCQNCNGHIQFYAVTLSKDNNKTACPELRFGDHSLRAADERRQDAEGSFPSIAAAFTGARQAKTPLGFCALVGFILFLGYNYYHGIQRYNRFLDSMDDPRSKEEAGTRGSPVSAPTPPKS